MDKRSFYAQPEITETYDNQRFGGASGAWVNRRELMIIKDLLPPNGRILDLGCGTGRLMAFLKDDPYEVVGLDTSMEMLGQVRRKRLRNPLVAGDAFALPLPPGSFDAVVGLRLAFHYFLSFSLDSRLSTFDSRLSTLDSP